MKTIDLEQDGIILSLQNGYKKKQKKQIELIPVPTSFCEIDITNDKELEEQKRVIVKEAQADESDIISAIKTYNPDWIEKEIYWYPKGRFYFVTDKNICFNLKEKPRPFTLKEEVELEELKKKILLGQTQTNDSLIEGARKRIREIIGDTEDEPVFTVHPLAVSNQIRIYFSGKYKGFYKELGYTVIEQQIKRPTKKINLETGELETVIEKVTTHSIKMSTKAFIGACKADKIPSQGFYHDEQGAYRHLERTGLKKEITLTDWNGVTRIFVSESAAAKELGLDRTVIRNAVKNGGLLKEPKKKKFTLISPTLIIQEFKSIRDAADKLGVPASTMKRYMKGKQSGDKICVNGIEFRVEF